MARKKRKAGKPSPTGAAEVRLSSGAARLAIAALCALAVAHAAVFAWRVADERRITLTDVPNYVAVARNLSQGRGFVQSAPGFNQISFWGRQFNPDYPPRTRHTHSILYPLLIAAVADVGGLPHNEAVFILNGLAYVAALALVFLLGLRVWGVGAGLLAAAAFSLSLPGIVAWADSTEIFSIAQTEPVAAVIMLAVFCLLAKNPSGRMFAAAGILAGLAYVLRNGMLPLAGVGVLAALLSRNPWRMLAFFLPAAAAAGALRHLAGTGTAYDTYGSFFLLDYPVVLSQYFGQAGVLLAALAALALAAFWRNNAAAGPRRGWAPRFLSRFEPGEILMFGWIAGYSAFLLALATVMFFAHLNDRIIYPVKITAVVLAVGLAWRALPVRPGRTVAAAGIFVLAMAGAIARDWSVLSEERDASAGARVAQSEFLSWAGGNITPNDFVIGTDVIDLPYHFPDRVESATSISAYPFSPVVGENQVAAIVRSRCGQFDNFYLIIRKNSFWGPMVFGPFLDGIRAGRPAEHVEKIADFADGTAYRLTHCRT